ncbi:MAG: Protein TolB [Thermoanaerobaculia bacterium]|nr:Protein TolB [Thermoanaerobaculia bacterium]
MFLQSGTRIGPYEVIAPLGGGGGGTLYQARDTKLGRDVALKILVQNSPDPAALSRFIQEARAASSLSHPNLVTVFDTGNFDGNPFIVMELVPGESLRDRLDRGPLSLRSSLKIAKQAAAGLAKAHEAGIVHRDLKPENIMIRPDGLVKIIDFGLAKLTPTSGIEWSHADERLTRTGFVVGTAYYMSPEQARGEPVTFQSDQFAVGILLYEMLSGNLPFASGSAVQTMVAIIESEPKPLGTMVPGLPPALLDVVRRCLEKDPRKRYGSTRELLLALEAVERIQTVPAPAPQPTRGEGEAGRPGVLHLLPWIGVALVCVTAAFCLGWVLRSPPLFVPPPVRPLTFSGQDFSPDASPRGDLIAFVSARDGRFRIWLKDLQTGAEVPLTEGPDDAPRFSPDASQILFIRDLNGQGELFRVPAVGGEPRRLLTDVSGADYSPSGREVVFTRWLERGGKRVSLVGIATADGGDPRIIVEAERLTLHQPRWSPDGGLIVVTSDPLSDTLGGHFIVDVKSRTLTPVMEGAGATVSAAAWAGDRGLVFARAENSTPFVLNANRASELLLVTPGRPKKTRTLFWLPSFGFGMDILDEGKLVLEARVIRGNLQELGLSGKHVTGSRRWFTHGPGTDRQPVYSPDGRFVVFASNRTGNWELWRLSLENGALKNLTENSADEWDPAFVGGGDRLLWSSNRTGYFEIWISSSDGSGLKRLSNDGVDAQNPSPTPDGRFAVYSSTNPARLGLWRVDLASGQEDQLIKGRALLPEVSPDGEIAAYLAAGEGGRSVIRFVRLRSGEQLPLVLEAGSGRRPGLGRSRWFPDGRSIAYTGLDEKGALAILVSDFDPNARSPIESRVLLSPDPGHAIETFGIARDGKSLTAELVEPVSSLAVAEGVAVTAARPVSR